MLEQLTNAAAAFETAARQQDSDTVPQTSLSSVALKIARMEVGCGESDGNNRGPDVERYRGDTIAGAWCASFASWCFEQAAEQMNAPLPFKRSNGAKKLYRNVGRAGAFVDRPRVGDVACWQRGNGSKADAWKGHVGIVSKVEGDRFWTIEGNRGKFPSRVREFEHRIGERRLIGFARI